MSDDERGDRPEPTPVNAGLGTDKPWRDRELFQWAMSASLGGVSEIAVLTPIRKGCPPGERRTYEQVAREAIGNLAARHAQGLPTELGKLSTIHFGRIIILRPEQYLSYSTRAGVHYYPEPGFIQPARTKDARAASSRQVPEPIDDFREVPPKGPQAGANERTDYRSWILTLVEFDGDLKVYMRDIARSLNGDFDAIFKTCEAYPGADRYEDWWSWIRRFQVNVDLFLRHLSEPVGGSHQAAGNVQAPVRRVRGAGPLADRPTGAFDGRAVRPVSRREPAVRLWLPLTRRPVSGRGRQDRRLTCRRPITPSKPSRQASRPICCGRPSSLTSARETGRCSCSSAS
jgi:hypothetical protein